MCRCMGVVVVRVRQPPINRRKIFRRRSARIALPRRPLIAPIRAPHQMPMVLIQQPRHPQQIPNPHKVRPQILHHRLLRTGCIEIQLSAEDGRKYVELLMGHFL